MRHDCRRTDRRAHPPIVLGGSVLLSVLLHGLLLAHWPSAPPVTDIGVAPLHIALIMSTPQARVPTVAPASMPAVSPPRRTAVAPQRPAVPPPLPASSHQPATAGATAAPATPALQADTPAAPAAAPMADARPDPGYASVITAHIRLELARHFHYPSLAVRRGWQGTVLLGFRVGPGGDIENPHIAQSSGHALLDRAALGALGKIHKITLDGTRLRAALDLQLPVIYRLEES